MTILQSRTLKTKWVVALISSSFVLLAWTFTGKTATLDPHLGTVHRGSVAQLVSVSGTFQPAKRTFIYPPYTGYIKKIYVKVGQKVKIGTPLVTVVQSLNGEDESFPIRSSINGVVTALQSSEGEYVRDSAERNEFIMRVDDISKFYVAGSVAEIDRHKLKLGQEAKISASSIYGKSYKGIIRNLNLASFEGDKWAMSQVVDFKITIEVLNPDEDVLTGLTVVADIETAKKPNVLILGHEFIFKIGDEYFVTTIFGERKKVTIGLQNEKGVEIVDGLKEDEQVRLVNYSEISQQGIN